MRVSTQMLYGGSAERLSSLQSQINRLSQQVGTGKAVLSPSDDPVKASQILANREASSRNEQFAVNRATATNRLAIADGALSRLSQSLIGMQEEVIRAGSGAISDDQLGIAANALRGLMDEALGLANTTDGAGHRLFAGMADDQAPFQAANGYAYSGAPSAAAIAVDEARSLEISMVGDRLFPATEGQNLFQHLNSTVAALTDPGLSRAQRQASLDRLARGLETTLQAVTEQTASVGVRLQELERLDSLGLDRGVQLTTSLASLQDLDYNQALSDLARQQLALQAAQKTFQVMSSLSLFNYLR